MVKSHPSAASPPQPPVLILLIIIIIIIITVQFQSNSATPQPETERKENPLLMDPAKWAPPLRPTDHGIAAVREKVMLDLQTAADKMKDAIFKEGLEEGVASVAFSPPPPLADFPTLPSAAVELPHGETHRPWSLRTRRAACKTTLLNGFSSGRNGCGGFARSDCGGGKALTVDASMPISGFSPVSAAATDKSPLPRSGGEKKDREKFSVALSKRAIEEDFLTMVNHRPPRRPKKRAKFIQKQLDTLFPGLWLTEVTADMYKVTEAAP
ncbi:uncharacterized protein [Primulina eburnea]|uniref:uncharacterized protein n=1 Tax=Primulina eburnea TaxID=1245227 RepID=UPI003C6C2B2F